MGWDKVLGQSIIKENLQRTILEGRYPNAYLFFGNEGVGKFATALEFVKTASCLTPRRNDNSIEACETCKNCISINKSTYPNLEFIFSLPASKAQTKAESVFSGLTDEQLDEINRKLIEKINSPYVRFQIAGASQIRIAQIRELRKNLALSNALPMRRFVIIINAEEMRSEAQNAFLKTLEEPRDDVTFILLSVQRNLLLPTIVSRCIPIYFPPIEINLIKDKLISDFMLSEEESNLIARFANGSFTNALDLINSNIIASRDKFVNILRIGLKKEVPFKVLSEEINSLVDNIDKKQSQHLLMLLEQWIRDAIVVSKSSDERYVINYDDIETLRRFAKNFASKPLYKAIQEIENANYMVLSNVAISSVFLDLVIKLRQIILES
ncbi:MAG: hypothetical protein N2517_04370 [Ignavibacteria bacterium]|nr:hypothetical protein [Ignavibacteria bacterium]